MNPVKAQASDIEALWAEVRATNAWLKTKNVLQWTNFPREFIEEEVSRGDVYVLRSGTEIAAAVTLSPSSNIWDEPASEVVFLNRIVVNRRHAGKDLGKKMIEWAEGEARRREKRLVRLVCAANNSVLRDYYSGLGFELAGEAFYAPYNMTFARFQKRL